jgi:hypothetical protein
MVLVFLMRQNLFHHYNPLLYNELQLPGKIYCTKMELISQFGNGSAYLFEVYRIVPWSLALK